MTIRSLTAALAFVLAAACATDVPSDAEADSRPRPIRTTKPATDVLKRELTPLQFEVTQQNGTEMPFKNAYHDHKQAGLYVDITTGQPLFSSLEKFDSGTGWPSFWKPIAGDAVVDRSDRAHGVTRVEVRSKVGDAHLGHVFDDGPKPTGLRYCINSAALRFIPVDQLDALGYGAFKARFAVKR